jgi:phenylalanyl-tRNA synthetase alpha chain
MIPHIDQLLTEIEQYTAQNKEQLEQFKSQYTGKKGVLQDLLDQIKNIPAEQRKEYGQQVNKLKEAAQEKLKTLTEQLENLQAANVNKPHDLTLPVIPDGLGALHPLTQTTRKVIQIFERMGFNISDGPEIEDDWHNFTALNFPLNHPARDMQDTFFISKGSDNDIALRTHTSSVQVRVMEKMQPPMRTVSIGRVYRNEAISVRAHCLFHQVEGFYVDKNVSFKDLKDTLYHFVRELFGSETKIRFRPSFFPFTEPSAEMDISCHICGGKGCNVCKHSGWVEIGGCGMIDPNVMKNCNIDPEVYTGFAFGMGIERITMLRNQIKDIRLFTENDVRFLKQFS